MRHFGGSMGMVAAVVLIAGSVQADVVLDYSLVSVPNESVASVDPTLVAAGLTATPLTRGPGIGATNLTRGFSANNWTGAGASRANAIEIGQYFQFGFTVAASSTVSLSQLDVSLRRSAADAPMNYEWQYSLDGFATPGTTIAVAGSPYYATGAFTYLGRSSGSGGVASDFNYMTQDVTAQGNGNPMPPLDLSGFDGLQNLTEGASVTFRLFGWGAGASALTNTVAIGRDFGPKLTGVAVPEPGSLLLAGLGGLLACGVGVSRRRRSAA
jgi:hypothetical protein